MSFTEIKEVNGNKYYYRVLSVRKGKKVEKKRVYLGKNLEKKEIEIKEKQADKDLELLSTLLSDEEIKVLEKVKEAYKKEPKENFENRYEHFCSLFTYDSTAIEGNTLTLQETAQLLFENIPPRKSLREINETLNHRKAFDFILKYDGDITGEFIFQLHRLVVQNTLKPELENQIGKYRELQVYIRGTKWMPPKPEEVPGEMRNLLVWYSKNKKKLHPLILVAYFHTAFETIHPFVDGNGRVGRLLMNFVLHKNKFPMINIPNSIKHEYYSALQDAQLKGNLKAMVGFLFKLIVKSKIRF